MAALRLRPAGARGHELTDDIVAAHFPDDKPIAFMFGLPMNAREALAYMSYEADTAAPLQLDILKAWKVKMTLVHGSWAGDELPDF